MLSKAARNERAKLTATYVNNVAVALFAVGALGPLLSVLYGVQGSAGSTLIGGAVCLLASYLLHLTGRRFLRGLED